MEFDKQGNQIVEVHTYRDSAYVRIPVLITMDIVYGERSTDKYRNAYCEMSNDAVLQSMKKYGYKPSQGMIVDRHQKQDNGHCRSWQRVVLSYVDGVEDTAQVLNRHILRPCPNRTFAVIDGLKWARFLLVHNCTAAIEMLLVLRKDGMFLTSW